MLRRQLQNRSRKDRRWIYASVPSGRGGRPPSSRWDALKDVRNQADEDLKNLAEKVAVREFVFDRTVEESDEKALEHKPDGGATAIGSSLESTLTHFGDERIAGVLLLSDGANNF